MRKPFDHVSSLKVILAVSIGRKPPRSGVVHKGIVESLGDLMAKCGHILKAATEDPWKLPGNPYKVATLTLKAW